MLDVTAGDKVDRESPTVALEEVSHEDWALMRVGSLFSCVSVSMSGRKAISGMHHAAHRRRPSGLVFLAPGGIFLARLSDHDRTSDERTENQ